VVFSLTACVQIGWVGGPPFGSLLKTQSGYFVVTRNPAASRRSTRALVLESSRAMLQPIAPAPITMTLYVPLGVLLCERLRGGGTQPGQPLPLLIEKCVAHSSKSIHVPPTKAPFLFDFSFCAFSPLPLLLFNSPTPLVSSRECASKAGV